jgi:hypothetical protein
VAACWLLPLEVMVEASLAAALPRSLPQLEAEEEVELQQVLAEEVLQERARYFTVSVAAPGEAH